MRRRRRETNQKACGLNELASCWSMTLSISRALMCCFLPWSCKHVTERYTMPVSCTARQIAFPKLLERDFSHSVLHRFLDEVEALPARVELVLVWSFEVQQVANDLTEREYLLAGRNLWWESLGERPVNSKLLLRAMIQKSQFISESWCITICKSLVKKYTWWFAQLFPTTFSSSSGQFQASKQSVVVFLHRDTT